MKPLHSALHVECERDLTIDAANKFINDNRVRLGADDSIFQIVESIAGICVDRPAGPIDVSGTVAGRVFGEAAEIRWSIDRSSWRVWLLGKKEGGSDCVGSRKYYLLGQMYENGKLKGKYSDDHLTIDLNALYECLGTAAPHERPFLTIFEYYAEPSSSLDAESIEDELNQARVIAYRIAGIGKDKGSAPDKSEPGED